MVALSGNGVESGLGLDDFRKGAYGQRLIVSTAGHTKLAAGVSGSDVRQL